MNTTTTYIEHDSTVYQVLTDIYKTANRLSQCEEKFIKEKESIQNIINSLLKNNDSNNSLQILSYQLNEVEINYLDYLDYKQMNSNSNELEEIIQLGNCVQNIKNLFSQIYPKVKEEHFYSPIKADYITA